jgi:hypothetical protein
MSQLGQGAIGREPDMFRGWIFSLICVALIQVPGESLRADYPMYLIPRTPSAPTPHAPTYRRYPGRAEPVTTQAYSYGWFGAQPPRQWSRHFGYYNSYRQWSAR